MFNPKRVLITGGAGFIGSRLFYSLRKSGVEVTILDSLSDQVHQSKDTTRFSQSGTFILGDVRDREVMRLALRDVDCVIHLAAETGTGQSMYEAERYSAVNVGGTAVLLDLLSSGAADSVKRVIVASSRSIYGEGKYLCDEHGIVYPPPRNIIDLENGDFEVRCPICRRYAEAVATTEDSILSPASVYAVTKRTQEDLVLVTCRALGIAATSLRFQNVFGPGQSLSNPYTGILSIFSTRLLNGNSLNIFEDGRESRDFVYVDDVVDALVAAMQSDKCDGHSINIGSGRPTTVLSVVETLASALSLSAPFNISGDFRLGDIRHNFACIKKAQELLDWEPRFSFSDGIEYFADWVLRQEISEDNYQRSIDELKKNGLYR